MLKNSLTTRELEFGVSRGSNEPITENKIYIIIVIEYLMRVAL
jgi:hypothetical protein